MIKTRIKILLLVLTLVVFAFTALLNYFVASRSHQKAQQQMLEQLQIISQLDSWLHHYSLSEDDNYRNLANKLNDFSAITYWVLSNENNRLLMQKQSSASPEVEFAAEETAALTHSLHFDSADGRAIVLKLNFNSEPLTFQWNWLYLAVVLLVIILAILYPFFSSMIRQESYARFLLENESLIQPISSEKFPNPLNQAMTQLLLNYQLLLKDKMELTNQIRKSSYVDEASRLGNQLFFRAEFEVRLHNKSEAESGIMMLLSFVQPEARKLAGLIDFQLVAMILKEFITDIPNALVARLRNNDFGLLLPNLTQQDTDTLCKKLISQLEKSCFDHKQLRENFIHIGISAYKQGFDYYMVMAEADMALRNAQLHGGNSWFTYGQTLSRNKIKGHLKWRSFLQNVLDQHSVQLYGQTIVHFKQKEFEHLEVLARIEDGNETIAANTFLPMANECGLASQFDRQIIERVIKRCLYSEADISHRQFSVNLFIDSLLDDSFVDWLAEKLSGCPEISQHLCFEIKEVEVNRHIKKLSPVFKRFNQLGVDWCVESFGAPHEDLRYLDLLPIKQVKVDRRFINNIHSDQSQQLLLNTLLINLQRKNILVIADGVEKQIDANYLKQTTIDAAQGYYFSQPQRLREMENYLKYV